MATPATPSASENQLLACMSCGEQRNLVLDVRELSELLSHHEIRQYCSNCQTLTSWYGVEPDRRSGQQRRTSRHVRMELPIRVRSNAANLAFTEVTHTLNVSREGACFATHQPLREGMDVMVLVPYKEGEQLPETRGRVVRVEQKSDNWEVSVQFVR